MAAFRSSRATLGLLFAATVMGSSDARAAGPVFSTQASLSGPPISASATFQGNYLGYSVAIDGNTAVVGAPALNDWTGGAYVYVRTGTAWSAPQQLVVTSPGGLIAGDQFGYAVAVSGNTAVVGAPARGGPGSVLVFSQAQGVWAQQAEITEVSGAPGDFYGGALALRSGTLVVGAPLGFGTGAAYVVINAGGGWQPNLPQQDFMGSGDWFGFSVAISSDATTAMVGAFGSNNVYVLTSSGSTWSKQQPAISAPAGAPADFGYSVAVDGDTALIGADGAGAPGAAYIFTGTAGTWSLQSTLTGSPAQAGDFFGASVALSGNTAIVGAQLASGSLGPGAAYVYTGAGSTWTPQELLAPASGQHFGYSVATTTTTAVVGAIDASNSAGAAYIFTSTTPSSVPALGGKVALLGFALLSAGIAFAARPLRGGRLS